MKKILQLTIICSSLLIAISVSYYYVIFLPQEANIRHLEESTKHCRDLVASRIDRYGKFMGDPKTTNPILNRSYAQSLGILDKNGNSVPIPDLVQQCIEGKLQWLPGDPS